MTHFAVAMSTPFLPACFEKGTRAREYSESSIRAGLFHMMEDGIQRIIVVKFGLKWRLFRNQARQGQMQ